MLTDWPAIVERSGHLSPGGWILFHVCVCTCVCMLHPGCMKWSVWVCVCLRICLCVAYVCIPVAWIGLCVRVCVCVLYVCSRVSVYVCLLHNRLAPMWGSKSIIPAAFTYHFTELYVQCKQRLSLHANEPVSRSLDKEPFHSQHGVLPALWIRYLRLQVYSQALCAAVRSLTLYNGFLPNIILQIVCFPVPLSGLRPIPVHINVMFQPWWVCCERERQDLSPVHPPHSFFHLPVPLLVTPLSLLLPSWWYVLIVLILHLQCPVHLHPSANNTMVRLSVVCMEPIWSFY